MFGWQGKALRVNLSNGFVEEELISENLLENYVGGCRLAKEVARLEEVSAEKNKLIFASGALTGTGVPTGAFCSVAGYVSLQEDILCAPLLLRFGPELKCCGYDVLIIEGKAPEWCYLFITDEEAKVIPVAEMEGYTPAEIEEVIRSSFSKWYGNDIRIISIGKEGEQPSGLGGLVTDGLLVNYSGGLGNVFGEKRLKAIAVRGTLDIKLAKAAVFQKIITDAIKDFREKRNKLFETVHTVFARLELPLSREIHHGEIEKKACLACPIACLHQREGKFLPNFTVTFCFSELLEIENMEDALTLYDLCEKRGIDPVALSVTGRMLIELAKVGKADVTLTPGDTKQLVALIEDESSLLHKGGFWLAQHYQSETLLQDITKKIDTTREEIFAQIEEAGKKKAVLEALGLCPYALLAFPYDVIIKAFEAATGKALEVKE
ncbi:MAG: hypothetical protein J7M03_07185 [Candidatus Desulfofervidaceae bacterium]|nr:hypothetical protein [Candidatus Desulfofervidaceae bacterium]